jgi:hypothetical protein
LQCNNICIYHNNAIQIERAYAEALVALHNEKLKLVVVLTERNKEVIIQYEALTLRSQIDGEDPITQLRRDNIYSVTSKPPPLAP